MSWHFYESCFEFIDVSLFNQTVSCIGLREFFRANPSLTFDAPSTSASPSSSDAANVHTGFEDSEVHDEFYDAIANDNSLEDEDSDDDIEPPKVLSVNYFYWL